MNYYLRVINTDNSVTVKTRTINVTQPVGAPVINQFSVDPPAITLGQCVNIVWQVSGQVNTVKLIINTVGVWPNAPVSGSFKDCPVTPGQSIYRFTATGPGGTSQQQVTVNVNARRQSATATPVPPGPAAPTINGFTLAPTTVSPGALHHLVVDHGRRHLARGLAARQCADLGQCAGEPQRAGLSATSGGRSRCRVNFVYTLQAFNSAGQMVSQSQTLVVQPLSRNSPY